MRKLKNKVKDGKFDSFLDNYKCDNYAQLLSIQSSINYTIDICCFA